MSSATSATHTTITTAVAGDKPDYSIRQICLTALYASDLEPKQASRLKAEAKEMVIEHHGASAAAEKFGKHYAWYKSQQKKLGKIKGGW